MRIVLKYMGGLTGILLITWLCSCKKLATVDPPSSSVNSGNVYNNDATAIAAVTNIYAAMSTSSLPGGGITSVNLFPGLSADELTLFSGTTSNSVNYYYSNSLSSVNLSNPDFWSAFYKVIFDLNAAIDGLNNSNGLTAAVKQQLTGEVLFMRAFCYFYLVNLYGDVPLTLTTNYTTNAALARTPQAEVYKQIIADLKTAENLLATNYVDATLLNTSVERVRPIKWAASALLARAYLYLGDYADAETEASAVIGTKSLFDLVPLNKVFLMNSSEAIWQLQPVNAGWNTQDATTWVLTSTGPNPGTHPFYISSQLLSSFEPLDLRRSNWIDSITVAGVTYYYPYKYESATFNAPVTEYEMVFRLSEQYLIRSEARAEQGNLAGAIADIDAVRVRAGLGGTTQSTQEGLLAAILHERQAELFTEWGHRWLDLKRTGTVDAVMSVVTPLKGGSWNTNWKMYPIARNELLLNNKLVQNAGY